VSAARKDSAVLTYLMLVWDGEYEISVRDDTTCVAQASFGKRDVLKAPTSERLSALISAHYPRAPFRSST
jgi:hypothetical protein